MHRVFASLPQSRRSLLAWFASARSRRFDCSQARHGKVFLPLEFVRRSDRRALPRLRAAALRPALVAAIAKSSTGAAGARALDLLRPNDRTGPPPQTSRRMLREEGARGGEACSVIEVLARQICLLARVARRCPLRQKPDVQRAPCRVRRVSR